MQVVRNVCLEKRCKNLSTHLQISLAVNFLVMLAAFPSIGLVFIDSIVDPNIHQSAEVSFSSSRELRPSFALPLFPQETQNVLQLVFQPFFLLVTPSVVVFSLISIFVEPRNVF